MTLRSVNHTIIGVISTPTVSDITPISVVWHTSFFTVYAAVLLTIICSELCSSCVGIIMLMNYLPLLYKSCSVYSLLDWMLLSWFLSVLDIVTVSFLNFSYYYENSSHYAGIICWHNRLVPNACSPTIRGNPTCTKA